MEAMTKTLRILVVEDSPKHQESARQTLRGHEVTIVPGFDEYAACWKDPTGSGEEGRFDVVLTDLQMPMAKHGGGTFTGPLSAGIHDPAQLVPYGWIIALHAALKGAKYVGLLTDANHHKGALSAAMDLLGPTYYRMANPFRPNFIINGAMAMFVHTPFLSRPKDGNPACVGYDGKGCRGASCYPCRGTGIQYEETDLKDWGTALRDLVAA